MAVSKRGDGAQFTLRIQVDGQSCILKHYGRKRGLWRTFLRNVGTRLGLGKTCNHPRSRCDQEASLLRHWRAAGFDTPEVLEVGVDTPFLLMQDCSGPTAKEVLRDHDVDLIAKTTLVRRIANDAGNRHDRALAENDHRLIHAHPSMSHVLVHGNRLVHIDMEKGHPEGSDVEDLVRYEFLGLFESLARASHREHPELCHAFVGAYPCSSVLQTLVVDGTRLGPRSPWVYRLQMALQGSQFGKRDALSLLREALNGQEILGGNSAL